MGLLEVLLIKNNIDFSFEGGDEGNDESGSSWVQMINDVRRHNFCR